MRTIIATFSLLLIFGSISHARIRHVPENYSTIQAGMNVCFEGDTVLVASGIYRELINYNGVNITVASHFITTGDSSYIESTIIDGNNSGPIVSFNHDESEISVLKGFTIRNGQALNGGGILCVGSSPTICNNIIRDNTAVSPGKGGGILCDSSSSPQITYNQFLGNDATYGGGISCLNNSRPNINHNIFNGQVSSDNGAAIYCSYSDPPITYNYFSSNSAFYGGGICCYSSAPSRIKRNYFRYNTAYNGGAIYCYASNATIDSNTIISNHASSSGGGINCHSSSPTITADSIINNTATGGFGGGINITESSAAISRCFIYGNQSNRGGGFASWSHCNARITECIFRSNFASETGGGALCEPSISTITGNQFISNTADVSGGGLAVWGNSTISRNLLSDNYAVSGGAIACKNYKHSIFNNVVYGNGADNGGGIYCDGDSLLLSSCVFWADTLGDGTEIDISDASQYSIRYCDIYGGFEGEGNINTEPQFRNPQNGDYHLMSADCGDSYNSPCIDSGDRIYIDSVLSCQWGLGGHLCDMGLYGGRLFAGNTIFVPEDYPFIQDAINAAQDRDTILISPGTYWERLNLGSKKLVLASMFLSTGDTSYIPTTIIDGDSAGTVITISGRQDSTTAIIGLTISNGYSATSGGGIACIQSSPRISNNIIRDNLSAYRGGGFLATNSNPIFTNNIVTHNRVYGDNAMGGGIFNSFKFDHFSNNVVCFNEANGRRSMGGGIYLSGFRSTFQNNTIVDNVSEYRGGGIYGITSFILNNDIIWGNIAGSDSQLFATFDSLVSAIYCDIEGGWAGYHVFDFDPLFCDVQNIDFRLMSVACGTPQNSPCIDIGNPAITDSLLSCWRGLGEYRSDLGAYGGGVVHPESIDDDLIAMPSHFQLFQNYPNPFNAQTIIEFEIFEMTSIKIEVFDILGQKQAALFQGEQNPGRYSITWNATGQPSGLYFVRLSDNENTRSVKALLVK
jgi:hypothetical protein